MKKRMKQIASFWHEYQWSFIGVLALVALVLGLSGFAEYYSNVGTTVSSWDIFYHTLRLFTLESAGITGELPWQLQTARFLAPMVVIYTAVNALLVIFRDQLNTFRLRKIHDHIIVCGLGEKGYRLAAGFVEQGECVVGIELDGDNSKLELCRELGIIVLSGNAADYENLKRAGVHRARYFFSVCGDDGINAMVGALARTLVSKRKTGMLAAYVHITDPGFTELLRGEELSMLYDEKFTMEFFNIYERGAHALLAAYPPLPEQPEVKGVTCQVIIVGLDLLGASLLRALVRIWKITYKERDINLKLVIVDHDIEKQWNNLVQNHPHLGKLVDVQLIETEVDFAKLEQPISVSDQDVDLITYAYVCHDDERLSLSDALKIRRQLNGYNVQVVACTNQESGLGMQVSAGEKEQGSASRLASFGLFDNTCTPDLLLYGVYEVLARASHNSYVKSQWSKGETRETNFSLVFWDELPETLKQSNRDQAKHIGTKLKEINCSVGPVSDWEKELLEISEPDIKRLAKMEHECWYKERQADGWRFAEGVKNPKRKTSPDMLEWKDLKQVERDKDEDVARNIPSLVAQAGFEVYKLS